MANQVLFVQGGGAHGTHDEWDSKLVDSLERKLGPDYDIRYPRMPNEADPEYARWKTALEKEFAKLDDGAFLMGHSVGGTILISVLAEDPPDWTPRGIFLIAAPFVGQDGWPSEDVEPMSDLGARLPAQTPVYLYHGSEDGTAPFEHVGLYERAIPQAVVRRLTGRDHQLNNDLSEVAADMITAVRSRTRPATHAAQAMFSRQPVRAYLGFLGLTLLNPWTVVYLGVLVLGGHTGMATGTPALAAFAVAGVRRLSQLAAVPGYEAGLASCNPAPR